MLFRKKSKFPKAVMGRATVFDIFVYMCVTNTVVSFLLFDM